MAIDVSSLASIAGMAGGPVGMGVSAGLQAAMGVAQMIDSAKKNKTAKAMQRSLVRPEYNISQNIYDNQALAESRVSQGLSDAAMVTYENNMDRTMTTSIDAILRGGGNVNSIADLYDSSEDNFANLALLEEEMRLKNTQMYIAQNERMADEQDKAFQINEWSKFKDSQQAIAELKGQAAQGKWQGMNTVAGAVGNYVQGNMMQNNIDQIYGKGGSGNVMTTPTNRVIPQLESPSRPAMINQLHLLSAPVGVNANLRPTDVSYKGFTPAQHQPETYTQYMQRLINQNRR